MEYNPLYQKRLEAIYQDATKYTVDEFNLLYPELFMGYKLMKRLLEEGRFKEVRPPSPERYRPQMQRRSSPRQVSAQPPPPKPQPIPTRKYVPASPKRRSPSPPPMQVQQQQSRPTPPSIPPPQQSRKRSRSPESHANLEERREHKRPRFESTSTFDRYYLICYEY